METLVNFRDLGGLIGIDERKLKTKKLLRSGELVKLSADDISRLVDDLKLRSIIDFRSADEVKKQPNDTIKCVDYMNIDVLADTMQNVPSFDEMLKQLTLQKAETFMLDVYAKLVTSKRALAGYRMFIDALLSCTDGALLFHCAAGKDRTGFGAAIILKILGVSDHDIMEDYLKTIEGRQAANKAMIEKYRTLGLSDEQLAAFSMMMSVKREYLQASFDIIDEVYGNFDGYLYDGLGVTAAQINTLRELYLD